MTLKHTVHSWVSVGLIAAAVVVAPLGQISAFAADDDVTVTIVGYLDGQVMTADSVASAEFPMTATWDAENIGAGSGQFSLSATGYNTTNAYSATTVAMTNGADYGVSAVLDGSLVGAACTPGSATSPAYALAGYTVGDTMDAAIAGTVSLTSPNLTAMTSSKYVIVWNTKCVASDDTSDTFRVHIRGYLDGVEATAAAAGNYQFPMTATWQAENVNGGVETTGTYTLGSGEDVSHPYQADTVEFQDSGSYRTSAVTGGSSKIVAIGEACTTGQYGLLGYKTSAISFADAANATLSTTAPAYTDISEDQYVLVMTKTCGDSDGEIQGEVGTVDHGALAVTSVKVLNSTATADGTWENGWKYLFYITVPDNETNLSMKFGNWSGTATANTIAAANNMRISSIESDSNDSTLITGANTYSAPTMHIVGDVNTSLPGKQIEVLVEVAIPAGTANGSYTTTYGIKTVQ